MNLFKVTNVLKYDIAGTARKIADKNPNDTFHHDIPNNCVKGTRIETKVITGDIKPLPLLLKYTKLMKKITIDITVIAICPTSILL